ncbi:uncharacterized protein BJX67DRAFT_81150 [Aspergillus lucknowensis]|uniref:Uncharacterized protein n=1 Tax=Aspergillus lucknowensis TaxID=176173 RepID=A0ABR4LRV4_9EURO
MLSRVNPDCPSKKDGESWDCEESWPFIVMSVTIELLVRRAVLFRPAASRLPRSSFSASSPSSPSSLPSNLSSTLALLFLSPWALYLPFSSFLHPQSTLFRLILHLISFFPFFDVLNLYPFLSPLLSFHRQPCQNISFPEQAFVPIPDNLTQESTSL